MIRCVLCLVACAMLGACAPVLRSTITPPPDHAVQQADRIVLKGFDFQQYYVTGRDKSYTPAIGVGYSISKIGSVIAHTISSMLGFSYTQTQNEQYGDIGTVRTAVKTQVEDSDVGKAVLTLQELNQLRLPNVPTTLIYEGRSGNEAVVAATPWYWSLWNIVDYVTLMAFIGVPTHYEREATVTLVVLNERYERIGKREGYALLSKACYVKPAEDLAGETLIWAYRDAVNKAAAAMPAANAASSRKQ